MMKYCPKCKKETGHTYSEFFGGWLCDVCGSLNL